MSKKTKQKPKLHLRNKNRNRYDFEQLIKAHPALKDFVQLNIHNSESIDFANPKAVKALNTAILKHHYQIQHWDVPENYLVPPIPGRADYIHHIADLLGNSNYGKIPRGQKIKCVDIGVGSNCIYPIIGTQEYDWSFIGTDIDPVAIESVNNIVDSNKVLRGKIEARLQTDYKDFFYGVIRKEEKFDLSICNPPFHGSKEEATSGTARKVKRLTNKKTKKPTLNFGGVSNELIYDGGEDRFIGNMIKQSKKFGKNCYWFSTLVSKASNLKKYYAILNETGATKVETINMGQGNKTSRIVAWSFLTKEEQSKWKNTRWNVSKRETLKNSKLDEG
jgi:23S rRNA (adenine1618-N6)-methyltransferase